MAGISDTAIASGDSGPSNAGHIVDQSIERELHDRYLTYAMSTITDRALPDVRDGLKPSQRRILVAMNDLNLGARAKHRKCAKICGDTSGNYHPHGESVIYPTLVNMGQDWKIRYRLIDKQGNFGSIDGDPPAAMRYTEARMTAAAVELLQDINLDTVDFRSNYDETRREPTVLPGKLPNLLINGSTGIAVGMACSSPPHNIREVCDAIIAVIDKPEIALEELMEVLPGPDFPTGGAIQGRAGIIAAYAGGPFDMVIQRIVDAKLALPGLIIALAIRAALGASLENVIIAIIFGLIPVVVRTVRSQVLSIKEMDYITAARAVGATPARIVFRHIAPNCFAIYLILATYYMGFAIILEATLSFLGVGAPPDAPSWGGMLNAAVQEANPRVAPWTGIFPGLTIFIVVMGFNLLGDAMRDVMDPRLRRGR